MDSSKNMAARGRGLFSLYIYIEALKLFLSETNGPISIYIFVEMFLWWSSTKIVQAIWIRQKNMTARGQGLFSLYIYIENFKNLLVRNHWIDFNITFQKCFFCNLLQRLFKPLWFVKKHCCEGAGLFPIYLYRKIKKSSCQKPLDRFLYNLAKMFPWWSSTKIVQAVSICQKTWPLGGGAYFPRISI